MKYVDEAPNITIRLASNLLDLMFVFIFYKILSFAFVVAKVDNFFLEVIVVFLAYYSFFVGPALKYGASFWQAKFGLIIVSDQSSELSKKQIIIRQLVALALTSLGLPLVNLFSKKQLGLWDYLAKTRLIKRELKLDGSYPSRKYRGVSKRRYQ